MSTPGDWHYPEQLNTEDGAVRRVGIEIELQGIDVMELASLTAETLGGSVERISSAEFNVAVPKLGTFRIEVDFALLQSMAKNREDQPSDGAQGLLNTAVDLLGGASAVVVPCEVVSPPIPITEMAAPMDQLVERLREAGARGTRQSVLFAFGVHLNVEPPALDAATALDYIRAFVCLYDWIVDDAKVDLSRQLTPYIKRYPKDYELLIADSDYEANWSRLIDDYLTSNPTRDRALDMLPLFMHIDKNRVRATVDDALVKSRPTFHYRLADSLVDEPDWNVAVPWNRWVQIERLANDRERLPECLSAFAVNRERMLSGFDKRWAREVTRWLDN